MAASDARPFPIKGQPYRVTFPIYDADGDPVTAAATLDSEISKDGQSFVDCTNEATELGGTTPGIYFLDLTAIEMDALTVALRVQTGTAGAKTTVMVLNPYDVNTAQLVVDLQRGSMQQVQVAPGGIKASSFDEEAITARAFARQALDELAFTDDFFDRLARLSVLPNSQRLVTMIWEALTALYPTTGTTGKALSSAASAGDPWSTALPGAYGAGSAGLIVGTNLDTTISSRLAPTVAARTLDVSAAGEAGLDWANIGSPTTAQNLSATNIDVDQIVASVSGAVGSVAAGGIAAASFAAGAIDAAAIAANAIGASELDADAATEIAVAVWDKLTSAHVVSGSFGQALGVGTVIRTSTAQAGAAGSVTLDASASAVDSFYNRTLVSIVGGTGVGQARFVTGYTGATKVAAISPNWATNPDSTSVFIVSQWSDSNLKIGRAHV